MESQVGHCGQTGTQRRSSGSGFTFQSSDVTRASRVIRDIHFTVTPFSAPAVVSAGGICASSPTTSWHPGRAGAVGLAAVQIRVTERLFHRRFPGASPRPPQCSSIPCADTTGNGGRRRCLSFPVSSDRPPQMGGHSCRQLMASSSNEPRLPGQAYLHERSIISTAGVHRSLCSDTRADGACWNVRSAIANAGHDLSGRRTATSTATARPDRIGRPPD
jgi:hypothetical protein